MREVTAGEASGVPERAGPCPPGSGVQPAEAGIRKVSAED